MLAGQNLNPVHRGKLECKAPAQKQKCLAQVTPRATVLKGLEKEQLPILSEPTKSRTQDKTTLICNSCLQGADGAKPGAQRWLWLENK